MTCLAIVGSRGFGGVEVFVERVEQWIVKNGRPDRIVTGCARGTDAMARRFAADKKIPLVVKPAEWRKYGRAAGPIRNAEIVKECTTMLAFRMEMSPGTSNSIALAKKANKPVEVVDV